VFYADAKIGGMSAKDLEELAETLRRVWASEDWFQEQQHPE
jgi:hypothetical protein